MPIRAITPPEREARHTILRRASSMVGRQERSAMPTQASLSAEARGMPITLTPATVSDTRIITYMPITMGTSTSPPQDRDGSSIPTAEAGMRPRLRADGRVRVLHSTVINSLEIPADSDGITFALAAEDSAASEVVGDGATIVVLAASVVAALAVSGGRANCGCKWGRKPATNLPHEHE